jgi:hypothetical protein
MSSNQLSLEVTSTNLYINGLEVVYGSATTVTITQGLCRDSNNQVDMALLNSSQVPAGQGYVVAPLTLTTTTVGVNGVDVALTASTAALYQVFLISSSANEQPIACIATLAINAAPVMPFGYDTLRLIGYFAVDASDNILKAYTAGNGNVQDFFYDAPPATGITAGTSSTYAVVDLSTQVPWVNQTPAFIRYNLNSNAAADVLGLQGVNSTGDSFLTIAPVAGSSAHTEGTTTVLAQLNASSSPAGKPEINYKVSAGSVALTTVGFIFYR